MFIVLFNSFGQIFGLLWMFIIVYLVSYIYFANRVYKPSEKLQREKNRYTFATEFSLLLEPKVGSLRAYILLLFSSPPSIVEYQGPHYRGLWHPSL